MAFFIFLQVHVWQDAILFLAFPPSLLFMGTSLLSNGMSLQNTATKTAQRHTMQQASCLVFLKDLDIYFYSSFEITDTFCNYLDYRVRWRESWNATRNSQQSLAFHLPFSCSFFAIFYATLGWQEYYLLIYLCTLSVHCKVVPYYEWLTRIFFIWTVSLVSAGDILPHIWKRVARCSSISVSPTVALFALLYISSNTLVLSLSISLSWQWQKSKRYEVSCFHFENQIYT